MEIVEQTNSKFEHPLKKHSALPEKDVFCTPIAVRGILVPWDEEVDVNESIDFKVITSSGTEYFLLTNHDWKLVCSEFSWRNVRLRGLLNIKNMTVVPEEITTDDPEGSKAKVIPIKKVKEKLKKGFSMVVPALSLIPMVS